MASTRPPAACPPRSRRSSTSTSPRAGKSTSSRSTWAAANCPRGLAAIPLG